MDYNYFQEDFDRERMREAVRICIELGNHESWRNILAERVEPPDDALVSDDA